MPYEDRIHRELQHGERILENPEAVWGWETPAGQLRAARRASLLLQHAQVNADSRVLEIGCGTGLFTEKFSASGADITATDLVPAFLQLAERRGLSRVRWLVADAQRLCFPDQSFDVVLGNSILHHLDVRKALREVLRVLKPGGRLAFAEPNMANPQILLQKNIPWVKRMLGDSPDETAFFRRGVTRTFKELGLVEVQVFPFDFLHPKTPKLLIPLVQIVGAAFESVPPLRAIAGSLLISGRKL